MDHKCTIKCEGIPLYGQKSDVSDFHLKLYKQFTPTMTNSSAASTLNHFKFQHRTLARTHTLTAVVMIIANSLTPESMREYFGMAKNDPNVQQKNTNKNMEVIISINKNPIAAFDSQTSRKMYVNV